MITVLSRKPDDLASPDVSKVNKEIIEYCGLSTDEKPTGLIVTGSLFFEVDTNDLYIYSEETQEWMKFLGGSGGGGGDTPTGTIQITEDGTYDVTDYASAEVNVGGGIDVSTCTVSVTNSLETPVTLAFCDVLHGGGSSWIECIDGVQASQTREFEVLLYNGSAGMAVFINGAGVLEYFDQFSQEIATSGSIEVTGPGNLVIEGDGAITIQGKK